MDKKSGFFTALVFSQAALFTVWTVVPAASFVFEGLGGLIVSLITAAIVSYGYIRHQLRSDSAGRESAPTLLLQSEHTPEVMSDDIDVEIFNEPALFRSLFDFGLSGVGIITLEGHFIKVNPSFCQLFGYSAETLLSMDMYQLIHSDDVTNIRKSLSELIDNEICIYHAEHHCKRKNNDLIWVSITLSLIRNSDNIPLYFIMQGQNITLQKHAEEQLSHMAYHDPLTGLANRNKLEKFVNHLLAQSHRHSQSFALMFIDLDRFKNINDTLGHEAGDLLLQIIAERLKGTTRSTDLVARLGGDEFVIVVTDVVKAESVALISQKILQSVMQAVTLKGQEIYITTSIGISLYPFDGQNLQTLMKNADLSLYRAKEHGKNNYQFYTMEMTHKAQERMSLQNSLVHAVANGEFFLNYQPKMDLKTRKITGLEALLRWKNKQYGLVTPDEIIALAEETGLIIPVNEWILNTACQNLKAWQKQGHSSLTVSVNCSARQFKQANLTGDVLKILSESGISPNSLELEVTEYLIMKDPDNILRSLYALKDIGVQIAIDDFGTGYWSLNNLRRLSVDKIKIDRTFIKQIMVDETSADIVKAIIAMVNKLGIKSIAEGVETREQYDFLAREGCTEIQGYYLSLPLSDEAVSMYLKHPVPDAELKNDNEIHA